MTRQCSRKRGDTQSARFKLCPQPCRCMEPLETQGVAGSTPRRRPVPVRGWGPLRPIFPTGGRRFFWSELSVSFGRRRNYSPVQCVVGRGGPTPGSGGGAPRLPGRPLPHPHGTASKQAGSLPLPFHRTGTLPEEHGPSILALQPQRLCHILLNCWQVPMPRTVGRAMDFWPRPFLQVLSSPSFSLLLEKKFH